MHSGGHRSLFAHDNLVESNHLSCFVSRDQNNDLRGHISLHDVTIFAALYGRSSWLLGIWNLSMHFQVNSYTSPNSAL